jgi:Flp pilus assembly protein TadD
MAKRHCEWWLLVALLGCDPQPEGPDPMLVADPPPTEDGLPPGAGTSDFDRGKAYIKKEAYAEAIPHLDRALAAKPNNAEAHYYRALAYLQTGSRDKAEAGFVRALELDPELTNARVHLGSLYLQDPPQPDKAIAMLEPAAKSEPEAIDIREQLAFAYRLAGKKDKALQQYESALKMKDNPQVRLLYADLLFELKKEKESVAQMKKALAAYQKDVDKLAFIAHRFAKAEAYDECVKAFDMAIALKPKEPGFYLHRGLCKHSLKDEPGARKDFDKALSIDANFQPAHYYLGMSYLKDKASARGKALDHLKKAATIDKSNAIGKAAQEKIDELAAKKR